MRIVKRTKLHRILVICIALFCISLFFIAGFAFRCSRTQQSFRPIQNSIPADIQKEENKIAEYKRAEERTYLTFPEWYLVFNPQEYAQFIKNHKPSRFPYFASIHQFWGSYCTVYGITSQHYPPNPGTHLMVAVIGSSFTAEYVGKGLWENTLGRTTEALGGIKTAEDVYAAKVAFDYGEFILTRPWYEFPYTSVLNDLWQDVPFWGGHVVRKLERRIFLTLDFGVKALYAKIIELATHSVYGTSDTEIYASVQGLSKATLKDIPIRLVKNMGNDRYLVALPHYQGFTDTVPILTDQGVDFIDIAGNDEILLSAVAPATWEYNLKHGSLLFTMPLMNKPAKRYMIQVPTSSLGHILRELRKENVYIEHLYDF